MTKNSIQSTSQHRANTGRHNNYVHDRNKAQSAIALVPLEPTVGGSQAGRAREEQKWARLYANSQKAKPQAPRIQNGANKAAGKSGGMATFMNVMLLASNLHAKPTTRAKFQPGQIDGNAMDKIKAGIATNVRDEQKNGLANVLMSGSEEDIERGLTLFAFREQIGEGPLFVAGENGDFKDAYGLYSVGDRTIRIDPDLPVLRNSAERRKAGFDETDACEVGVANRHVMHELIHAAHFAEHAIASAPLGNFTGFPLVGPYSPDREDPLVVLFDQDYFCLVNVLHSLDTGTNTAEVDALMAEFSLCGSTLVGDDRKYLQPDQFKEAFRQAIANTILRYNLYIEDGHPPEQELVADRNLPEHGRFLWGDKARDALAAFYKTEQKQQVLNYLHSNATQAMFLETAFNLTSVYTPENFPDEEEAAPTNFNQQIIAESDRHFDAMRALLPESVKEEIRQLAKRHTIYDKDAEFSAIVDERFDASFSKDMRDDAIDHFLAHMTPAAQEDMLLLIEYARQQKWTGPIFGPQTSAPPSPDPVALNDGQVGLPVPVDNGGVCDGQTYTQKVQSAVTLAQIQHTRMLHADCPEEIDRFYFSLASALHCVKTGTSSAAVDALLKTMPSCMPGQRGKQMQKDELEAFLTNELVELTRARNAFTNKKNGAVDVMQMCSHVLARISSRNWSEASQKVLAESFYTPASRSAISKTLKAVNSSTPLYMPPVSGKRTGTKTTFKFNAMLDNYRDRMRKLVGPAAARRIADIVRKDNSTSNNTSANTTTQPKVVNKNDVQQPQAQAGMSVPIAVTLGSLIGAAATAVGAGAYYATRRYVRVPTDPSAA